MKFVGRALNLIQTLGHRRNSEGISAKELATELSTSNQGDKRAGISNEPGSASERELDSLARQIPVEPVTRRSSLKLAMDLSDSLREKTESLIEFNPLWSEIQVTAGRIIREPNFPGKGVERGANAAYYRWRASSPRLCLSVRASDALIEIFMVQTEDIALLSFAEFGSRLRAKFELGLDDSEYLWSCNRQPLVESSVTDLLTRCLQDLCEVETGSAQEAKTSRSPDQQRSSESIQKLMLEKENLIFKVLNQQEILKNELARSLHDTVLADLLMLKRHMRGDQELSKEEIIETVDEIAQQLRDICNECAPRNLHDWGLKVSIQDLLNRFGQRTAITCQFNCDGEIPNLPDTVELHVFRLMQECLNNIEKHARAQAVTISIERTADAKLQFAVADNGKGFNPDQVELSPDSGGMGVKGMEERAQLLRCFYPTKFKVESAPGKGTKVRLELTLPA